MNQDTKMAVISKLKKAQGMINKVISMIEDDKYCIDVLQQNLAASGYLKSVDKLILEQHNKLKNAQHKKLIKTHHSPGKPSGTSCNH